MEDRTRKAGGRVAVALVLAGGVGTLATIASPIGFNDDSLPSYRLTGWSSPPLTLVLIGLTVAFFVAGVTSLRSGVLGPRSRGLMIPVVVGAAAAIGIAYLSLGGHFSDAESQWGLGLLILSTSLGALGFVLCATMKEENESEVSTQRALTVSAVTVLVLVVAVAVAVPNFSTHPTGYQPPPVQAPQAH